METIQDLLPNEHILNFHSGVDRLPEWLGMDLKLILGAGDLDQKGLNVEQLSMFDVFFCEPWDNNGSLRANIDYLVKNYYHQKVICFINISDTAQVNQFCRLFAGRFILVDGYGGHTPHLPVECLARILAVGGKAVNVYETSDAAIEELDIYSICEKNTSQLTKNDEEKLFRGYLSLYEVERKNDRNEIDTTYSRCLVSHAWKKSKGSPIKVDWGLLNEMEPSKKLRVSKMLLAVLLKYDSLPRGIEGTFQQNNRIWDPEREYYELVLTKVAEGGRRNKQ